MSDLPNQTESEQTAKTNGKTRRVRDLTKSMSNAKLELSRAEKAYNKESAEYQQQIKDMQKNVVVNAFNIIKLANTNYLSNMADQSAKLAKEYAEDKTKTLVQKVKMGWKSYIDTHHLGILKRGTGGLLDSAITRHENKNHFINDARKVGADKDENGKTLSNDELSAKYKESVKLRQQIYNEQLQFDKIADRIGVDLAKSTPEYAKLNATIAKLKQTDFRAITNTEREMASDAKSADDSLLSKQSDRISKAKNRISKIDIPAVVPDKIKNSKKQSAEIVGTNDTPTGESLQDVIRDTSSEELKVLNEINTSLANITANMAIKPEGIAPIESTGEIGLMSAAAGVLKGSLLPMIGNLLKGALFGGGTGIASKLGNIAGGGLAAYGIYDSIKNMHKNTTDSHGNRMGFFDHKKGKSILDSRAGYYAKDALAGAKLGSMIGSIIPGVGTIIGAGVGALAGAGVAFFIDYKKEILGSLGKFKNTMSGVLTHVFDAFKNVLLNPIAEFSKIGTVLSKLIPDKIAAVIAYIAKSMSGIPTALWSAVKSYGASLSGVAKDMWRDIESAFSPSVGNTSAKSAVAASKSAPNPVSKSVPNLNPVQHNANHISVPVNNTNVSSTSINNNPTNIVGKMATRDYGNTISKVAIQRDLNYGI